MCGCSGKLQRSISISILWLALFFLFKRPYNLTNIKKEKTLSPKSQLNTRTNTNITEKLETHEHWTNILSRTKRKHTYKLNTRRQTSCG